MAVTGKFSSLKTAMPCITDRRKEADIRLPRPKTEIVVRGKKIVISEWHARVYRAFYWVDLDEDDIRLYLWAWCHKLDMDDVINKIKPEEIAQIVEECIMDECVPADGKLEDAVLRVEKELEAHPEIMETAEENKQRHRKRALEMVRELESENWKNACLN